VQCAVSSKLLTDQECRSSAQVKSPFGGDVAAAYIILIDIKRTMPQEAIRYISLQAKYLLRGQCALNNISGCAPEKLAIDFAW
jgi:hypothetical protein